MAIPCAPPAPPPPGQVPLSLQGLPTLGVPEPPAPLPLPPVARPRFVAELPLSNTRVLYWVATLVRATYSPTRTLFDRAAQAVLPAEYGTQFTANGPAGTPGYGIVQMPQGAIVVVSGTTNLGQWLDQVLNTQLANWTSAPGGALAVASMPGYLTSANTILAALGPLVPVDNQILFVGHSMGGAVAQLMHAWTAKAAANTRAESRCLTFAAPKPGDARLKNLMRTGAQVYRRLAIDGDFVPVLPPDLGVFSLAVPPALAAAAASWSQYKQPAGPYYVDASGGVTSGEEPFLPLLVTGAVVAAAAGNPLAPATAHLPRTFVDRLAAGFDPAAAGSYPNNWTNPTDLPVVNAELAAAGL